MAAINDCALNKMNNVDNEDKFALSAKPRNFVPVLPKTTRFIHGLSNAHALFVKYGDKFCRLMFNYLSPLSPLLMLPVFKASHSTLRHESGENQFNPFIHSDLFTYCLLGMTWRQLNNQQKIDRPTTTTSFIYLNNKTR